MKPRRRPHLLVAMAQIALATAALVGCGGDGASRAEEVTDSVTESGSLRRLAVVNGEQAVEAPVIRNCLAGGLTEIGAPSGCEERAVELPSIAIEAGDTLEFVTGAESGGVYAILNRSGDGHASAEAVDDGRRRWRLEIPEDVPVGAEISIGVGPTTTDSGSLLFAVATD